MSTKPFKSLSGVCPPGFKLNPISGNCVYCPEGKTINPLTGRCVNLVSKTLSKIIVPKVPKKVKTKELNKTLKTLYRQIKISEIKFLSLKKLRTKLLKQKSQELVKPKRRNNKRRQTI